MSTRSNRFNFAPVLLAALICVAAPSWAQSKLDFAIHYPEQNAWAVSFKWWVAEVEKATKGRVKFVPHYAGALAKVNETLKALRDGAIPAGALHAGAISGQMPAVAYLEAIGGMPVEQREYLEVLKTLRPVVEQLFHGQGVEYLWAADVGELIVVCRDHHLKSLSDWKERKVRTAGRWQAEQLRAMGGNPGAMDPSEQYIALQDRTIDCALSVIPLAAAYKLYEVAPKITLLRLSVNFVNYLMNKGYYDKISAADRASIKRLGAEAEKRSADHLRQTEMKILAMMKKQNADVYRLTDGERAELRKNIAPAYAKMAAESGAAGKQIGDILKRYW